MNEASAGQYVADDVHAAPTPPKNEAMFNATSATLPRILLRLTAPFSGRPRALQHAGAHDLFEHNDSSPVAKHFINPGPLQRLVRRLYC